MPITVSLLNVFSNKILVYEFSLVSPAAPLHIIRVCQYLDADTLGKVWSGSVYGKWPKTWEIKNQGNGLWHWKTGKNLKGCKSFANCAKKYITNLVIMKFTFWLIFKSEMNARNARIRNSLMWKITFLRDTKNSLHLWSNASTSVNLPPEVWLFFDIIVSWKGMKKSKTSKKIWRFLILKTKKISRKSTIQLQKSNPKSFANPEFFEFENWKRFCNPHIFRIWMK